MALISVNVKILVLSGKYCHNGKQICSENRQQIFSKHEQSISNVQVIIIEDLLEFLEKKFSILSVWFYDVLGNKSITQLTFTCFKSTMETAEKDANYAQTINKNTRTMSMTSFWCFRC